MKENPKISIIILNWNGWEDTVECLKSLSKITYSNYEMIVVDNDSTDDSVKHLKKFAKIKLILNKENLGFAGGNNTAMRQILKRGESDFVLLLNDDTVVDKDFLSELVKVAQGEKKAGILGLKIYYYDYQGKKNVIQSAGSMVNLYLGKFPRIKDANKTREVDFVTGACLLIKTEVIKKIGLLDESYFLLFEDMDWCLRAKNAGYSILYVPKSIIWHKVSQSFEKKNIPQTYYYTRNLFWFEFKHASIIQLLCFLLYYFIFVFPQYFLGFIIIKRNYKLWRDYTRGLIEGILSWRR